MCPWSIFNNEKMVSVTLNTSLNICNFHSHHQFRSRQLWSGVSQFKYRVDTAALSTPSFLLQRERNVNAWKHKAKRIIENGFNVFILWEYVRAYACVQLLFHKMHMCLFWSRSCPLLWVGFAEGFRLVKVNRAEIKALCIFAKVTLISSSGKTAGQGHGNHPMTEPWLWAYFLKNPATVSGCVTKR